MEPHFEYFSEESHVSTYNKFRPGPPNRLVEKIIQFTSEKVTEPGLAVDVGCGSGQCTEVLAPYFKKVYGFDVSEKIIREARKKCTNSNVFYSTCPGEKIDLADNVADLVTVGQALHWLDIPKFYSEADRILKPNGVLAVYGYTLPMVVQEGNDQIKTIIEHYYKDVLQKYTLPQSRKVYLGKYMGKEFNEVYFVQGGNMLRTDNFVLETEGNVTDVVGYVASWSAYQNYAKQTGENDGRRLLEKFRDEFVSGLTANESGKFKIRFQYFLLLGRKK